MIKRIDIAGVHLDLDDELRKYVTKKIGRLDRYIPRASRASVHADVKLKDTRARDKNERTCEVILHLPGEVITLAETTINIYAAVDIVEEKLKHQLQKYKDTHAGSKLHRRLLARLKGQPALEL